MKTQMRFQKIICNLVLISSAIAFVFALGLLTDIYYTIFLPDWGVETTLFKDMQPLNRNMVKLYLVMIALSTILYITMTDKRRKYYISNYISIALVSLYNISVSIWSIINVAKFRHIFLTETDFEGWKQIHELIEKVKYTESTFWLDINIAVACLTIIITLLLLANLIWKIILMKKEEKLLSLSQNNNNQFLTTEVE